MYQYIWGNQVHTYFQFIDETGIYRLSAGYIKEHKIKIDNQLEDNELFIVAKLLDEIKKRGE